MSEALKGENNPMYGKKFSKEYRKKLSQAKKNIMTPVVAIQIATGKVKIFEGQNECSRMLGVNQGNIVRCLKGSRKSAGGYTFKKINRDRRVFTVSQSSKSDFNRLRGIA